MEKLKMDNVKNNDEQIIRKKRKDIDNYVRALKAMICLRKFIIEKQGEFYFGGNLHYTNSSNSEPPQTPDFIVKLNNNIWIGETKKSLANPKNFKDYTKEYIESDLIAQLIKYDKNFQEISVEKHDIVLLAPLLDNEAIGYLKIKYLENKEHKDIFKNNFALIVYSIDSGGNTEFILIRLEYGCLENAQICEDLKIGYRKTFGELKEDLAKFKVYEENHITPIEYVMVILWTYILPEISNKSKEGSIVEWINTRKTVFEVSLEDLMEYLHKMYTLPSFANAQRMQFQRKQVLDAMALFENLKNKKEEKFVEKIEDDGKIKFKVTYRTLPEKNELDYILKALYKPKKKEENIDNEISKKKNKEESLDWWINKK